MAIEHGPTLPNSSQPHFHFFYSLPWDLQQTLSHSPTTLSAFRQSQAETLRLKEAQERLY